MLRSVRGTALAHGAVPHAQAMVDCVGRNGITELLEKECCDEMDQVYSRPCEVVGSGGGPDDYLGRSRQRGPPQGSRPSGPGSVRSRCPGSASARLCACGSDPGAAPAAGLCSGRSDASASGLWTGQHGACVTLPVQTPLEPDGVLCGPAAGHRAGHPSADSGPRAGHPGTNSGTLAGPNFGITRPGRSSGSGSGKIGWIEGTRGDLFHPLVQ